MRDNVLKISYSKQATKSLAAIDLKGLEESRREMLAGAGVPHDKIKWYD